jgi:hypothetical protein
MVQKKMTIETLAAMSQEQFLALEKKIDATRGDVKLILSAIENLNGQITDVKQSTLTAIDVVRLEERVDVIEKKLGITGCLKPCQTSQATDHEMDHRHTDHGFTRLG